jgi:hypothetical protein
MSSRLIPLFVGIGLWTGTLAAQSVETVRPGSKRLELQRLTPFADTARVVWTRNGETRDGPLQIETLRRVSDRGRTLWEHAIRIVGGRQGLDDTTWYDPRTLAPMAHHSHASDWTLTIAYFSPSAAGTIDSSGVVTRFEIPLGDGAFDPSAFHPVLRSLPFRPGAVFLLPTVSHENRMVRVDTVRVVGADTVHAGGEPVPVWRLDVAAAGRRVNYYVRQSDGRALAVVATPQPGLEMRILLPGVQVP